MISPLGPRPPAIRADWRFMARDSKLEFDSSETAALRARLDAAHAALESVQALHQRAKDNLRDTEARLRKADENKERWAACLGDSEYVVTEARRLCGEAQQAVVRLQQAFTHPVRKLPPEILAEIFEQCICGDPYFWDSLAKCWAPYHPQQAFFFAAVCRRWRWACIGHARIWAFLTIDLHSISPGTEGAWHTYLDTVFSRSRSAPLSVWVLRSGKTQARFRSFVQRILGAMPRCEDITLMISNLRANDSILALLTTKDTPKLQYVSISLLRAASSRAFRGVRLFPGVRELRRLKFEGDISEMGPLVFPALLSASLERPVCSDERDDLAALLDASPSLETLYLLSPKVAYDHIAPDQLAAPYLRTLTVDIRAKYDPEDSLVKLAFRIHFSALTELILLGDEPLSRRGILLLRALSQTVALTTLRLSSMSEQALLLLEDTFPFMTALVDLFISETRFTEIGWSVLCAALCDMHGSGTRWPCPALTRLSLAGDCSIAEDCKLDILLASLRRRFSAACGRPMGQPALMQRFLVGPWETGDSSALQAELDRAIAAATRDYNATLASSVMHV